MRSLPSSSSGLLRYAKARESAGGDRIKTGFKGLVSGVFGRQARVSETPGNPRTSSGVPALPSDAISRAQLPGKGARYPSGISTPQEGLFKEKFENIKESDRKERERIVWGILQRKLENIHLMGRKLPEPLFDSLRSDYDKKMQSLYKPRFTNPEGRRFIAAGYRQGESREKAPITQFPPHEAMSAFESRVKDEIKAKGEVEVPKKKGFRMKGLLLHFRKSDGAVEHTGDEVPLWMPHELKQEYVKIQSLQRRYQKILSLGEKNPGSKFDKHLRLYHKNMKQHAYWSIHIYNGEIKQLLSMDATDSRCQELFKERRENGWSTEKGLLSQYVDEKQKALTTFEAAFAPPKEPYEGFVLDESAIAKEKDILLDVIERLQHRYENMLSIGRNDPGPEFEKIIQDYHHSINNGRALRCFTRYIEAMKSFQLQSERAIKSERRSIGFPELKSLISQFIDEVDTELTACENRLALQVNQAKSAGRKQQRNPNAKTVRFAEPPEQPEQPANSREVGRFVTTTDVNDSLRRAEGPSAVAYSSDRSDLSSKSKPLSPRVVHPFLSPPNDLQIRIWRQEKRRRSAR